MATPPDPVLGPYITNDEWFELKGTDHAHCPCHCENPQPVVSGTTMLCGRCLILDGFQCEMVPCRIDNDCT